MKTWLCPIRRIAASRIAGVLCAMLPIAASADATLAWVRETRGVSIALDLNDNVYTVDYEQALGAEMRLTKRDSNGNSLWSAAYDQTSTTAWERASWVTTDRAGNAIVCGTLMSGYSNPVEAASIVMKFNPEGGLLWRRVYETEFDGSSVRKCLVDANDNVYVLGLGSRPEGGRVTRIKKFSPEGAAVWSYFDTVGIGAPVNFKLTPDNHLLVSGRSITGSFNGYAKVDLDGNPVWARAAIGSLTVGDSAGDAFGNSYLVHGQYGVANPGTVIKKLDPAGDLLWENVYALAGFRVEVGSDHRPVVSGFPNSGTVGAAFIKVNEQGGLLWSNLDADGSLALLAHAHMVLDRDNNAYLAAGTMSQMGVTRVNADGSSGWTRTIAYGYAAALALGNRDSGVYVVGGTTAKLDQGNPAATPTQPTVLSYLDLKSNSIYLGWSDNSSNETGFTVERCTGTQSACDGTPAAWSAIVTVGENVSTYIDGGLVPETTYSWRVKAFNAAGASPYSNTLTVKTLAAPVAPTINAPTNLKAEVKRVRSSVQVRLSWTDNATNETSFAVERCAGAGCSNFSRIASLAANTQKYVDQGASRSTSYRYRVLALNNQGNSEYSNIASVTTP